MTKYKNPKPKKTKYFDSTNEQADNYPITSLRWKQAPLVRINQKARECLRQLKQLYTKTYNPMKQATYSEAIIWATRRLINGN